jgi:hypothetical protein
MEVGMGVGILDIFLIFGQFFDGWVMLDFLGFSIIQVTK